MSSRKRACPHFTPLRAEMKAESFGPRLFAPPNHRSDDVFSTMNDKLDRKELRAEIKRGHFVRAALVAASLGVDEQELRELRLKALWQMSAVSRNGPGTKWLAQEYGFSKKELGRALRQYAEKMKEEGDIKPLEPCYDNNTSKYLTYEEWLDRFLNNWDKFPES